MFYVLYNIYKETFIKVNMDYLVIVNIIWNKLGWFLFSLVFTIEDLYATYTLVHEFQ